MITVNQYPITISQHNVLTF